LALGVLQELLDRRGPAGADGAVQQLGPFRAERVEVEGDGKPLEGGLPVTAVQGAGGAGGGLLGPLLRGGLLAFRGRLLRGLSPFGRAVLRGRGRLLLGHRNTRGECGSGDGAFSVPRPSAGSPPDSAYTRWSGALVRCDERKTPHPEHFVFRLLPAGPGR